MHVRVMMVAALAGCAVAEEVGVTPDVQLAVAPMLVPAGDSVTITLTTAVAGGVHYNLCTSMLEHRAGYDWQPVPSDRVCTMELRLLEPGAEARFTFRLPATLEAGEYRYHTRVERIGSGEMDDARSPPFRVQ